MKLKIYGVKDEVVGEIIFVLPSQNDGTMVRAVKGALLVKEPNQINTDIKDKASILPVQVSNSPKQYTALSFISVLI